MAEDILPKVDDLLRLCEVSHIAFIIDAPRIEPSACFLVGTSGDENIPDSASWNLI